jgi:hypothetical protein
MKKFAEVTGQEVSESLRQFARVACVNLSTATQPFGKDNSARGLGERAVVRDIGKVYYPATGAKFLNQATRVARGSANRRGKDPEKAAEKFKLRMLKYQSEGDSGALAKIAADMKFTRALFDSFDPSLHKNARNRRGRVGNVEPTLLLGGEAGYDSYVSKTIDKVGLTKAGWVACAEAIPLKRTSAATRGIPQWVTRHRRKATGNIQDKSRDRKNPMVIMTNATPWTSMVLTEAAKRDALSLARDNYVKFMNAAIAGKLRADAKLKGR